ncbi:NAD(P)/FAD-dependent oxidoreductase [Vagococcus sp.]|uniref:NAD(P)/FAD-dependent oxidoreductase n=1 Tax=Vagococcus sp. TaxID=1933889 RepID=UPI003F9BFCF5
MKQKIAIIGGGIVGSTTAFYLSKNKHFQVTLFDDGVGQATKAAAGIISPWLSQRRNKEWYYLAKEGAAFYQILLNDLEVTSNNEIFERSGTLLYKKDDKLLTKLEKLAHKRKEDAPTIGTIKRLSAQDVHAKRMNVSSNQEALFISGGAKVDGKKLTDTLQKNALTPNSLIRQKIVSLSQSANQWKLATQTTTYLFDQVVLTCGAWLPDLLAPLNYSVDIRPQKGQLIEYGLKNNQENRPVLMPVGEIDIIPFKNKWVIGATHENDQGFDLTPDKDKLKHLKSQAEAILPDLKKESVTNYRIGTRAYTSDFLPFFGEVTNLKNLWVASGLGSSGLTTGPIIGKTLADWIEGKRTPFEHYRHLPNRYVKLSDVMNKT